jgi:hypothetical protein
LPSADAAGPRFSEGPRNPCPGKLGVVREGALADLRLVDGDPIANVRWASAGDRP